LPDDASSTAPGIPQRATLDGGDPGPDVPRPAVPGSGIRGSAISGSGPPATGTPANGTPLSATVRAKHAASLIVLRFENDEPHMLMGMRGAKHRFMPNRLVFPGGRVDRADLRAPFATPLSPATERALRKKTNATLARGLAAAAARELQEETGLTLGDPPRLDVLHYLARAVTPPGQPIRFNARFLVVEAEHVSGELGGDGELEGLRFYGMTEALALQLALPTRRVLERLRLWLALPPAERAAQIETPVLLRDRGWLME
jgi:8-oxo-dGTP pyrophosphatase MutT (NUDIX family)